MSKLKGFTLIELIIALLVTVIVMALASSLYSGTVKYFQLLKGNMDRRSDFILLWSFMNSEVDNSTYIFLRNNTLEIVKEDTVMVEYQYEDSNLVRTQGSRKDTFKTVGPLKCFYDLQPIIDSGFVDKISFDVIGFSNLMLVKQYPNSFLLKEELAEWVD